MNSRITVPLSSELLAVNGLAVDYGDQPVLENIAFTVAPGETLALVGESGCGKSTTALAVINLLPPRARLKGSLQLDGRDLAGLSKRAWQDVRGNQVGIIFQDPMSALNPVLSIGEQISETLRRHRRLSRRAARAQALALLEQVRIPDAVQRFWAYPHEISGGQRQRVMIAMAVACRPRLLIADEPTTALDVTVQAHILDLLHELSQAYAMGVLLITHDLGVVGKWSDRVSVMQGGRIVESGATMHVLRAPQHPYTRQLLAASLHLDSPRHPRLVRAEADAGRPVLQVQGLTCHYRQGTRTICAVDNVSFTLQPGEVLGLVGESGCGKSTLSRALLGLLQPSEGNISLEGRALADLPEHRWRPRLQMVFQDPYASLNPRHTVGRTLDRVLRLHRQGNKIERRAKVEQMLEQVGLPANAADKYPSEFSGGQRQRIGIARALILRPKVVVLDEAVSSLDVSVRAQILDLLMVLKAKLGLAYLFISHDLAVVRHVADRVLVMQHGRIVERGDDALWERPQHTYTQSLIKAVPSAAAYPRETPVPSTAQWLLRLAI